MSGLTDKYETLKDENVIIEDLKHSLLQYNVEGMEEILKIWRELYGLPCTNNDRITKLVKDLKAFWECQIQSQNERKRNVSKSIEQAGKEAFRLEKVLGLKPEVKNLTCGSDVPLVVLEERIWKILISYQEFSDARIEEYSMLQKKEEELCSILNKKPHTTKELRGNQNGSESKRKQPYIPTSEEIIVFKERIGELERQKEQLEYEFETYKERLRMLLEQCKITPVKNVDRFVCFGNEDFPVTSQNLKLLISETDHYNNVQAEMIAEADQLRNEITSLYKKMFMCLDDLQPFFRDNHGFTRSTINNLKDKLNELKEVRKKNLKELIISHRKILDELWGKCCYSDEERAQFKPYNVDHWSEEVLGLHELEIEKVQQFYEKNKKIFQLSEKYGNLWDRLLHLEELASNKDRLFNNRGGCLLKEEKERKLIQKKVPTVKTELMALLAKYKNDTGKDFLYYGEPLQFKIEQKDEQREISKENEKIMRKVINEENLLYESHLGVRAATGNKRRFVTPQRPKKFPKLIKTTAHSTPRISRSASTLGASVVSENVWTRVVKENDHKGDSWLKSTARTTAHRRCDTPRPPAKAPTASTPQTSPTYESFQENITKHNLKRNHETCTHRFEQRVLRPRNGNKPRFLSEKKLSKFNTPVAETYTKSATVSKIPRATTPINPRPATQTATRRRLPIIF